MQFFSILTTLLDRIIGEWIRGPDGRVSSARLYVHPAAMLILFWYAKAIMSGTANIEMTATIGGLFLTYALGSKLSSAPEAKDPLQPKITVNRHG